MSKIAFLFPGQGAQVVGMGKQVHDEYPQVKELFSKASDVLGYDLAELCFDGPAEKLNSTVISQPALYVTSMAAVEVLKHTAPDSVDSCAGAAGLSLGEYSALAFAGVMTFEDGLRLVQKRGEAMQAAADETPSGMVSVLGLDREKVEAVCDAARVEGETLQVANLLCPGNIAVSGHQASCDRVEAAAQEAGAMKTIPLTVAGAFHTPIMQSAVDKLTAALSDVNFSSPRVPVYSNVDAQTHTDPDEIRALLVQQVSSPVLWNTSMHNMLEDGFDEFYEVGEGRVLRSLLKRINRKLPTHGTLA